MKIVTKQEFFDRIDGYVKQVKSGAIIIYPTDTIYGLGCNALVNNSVSKIRELKNRFTAPLSVIVPNKSWIMDNCIITPESQEWIDKLPGPYTLILPLKEHSLFSEHISPNQKSIGIRLPDHEISTFVEKLGYPLVTTSVNQPGRQFMTSLETLDPQIGKGVDLIISQGEIEGKPSQIISFIDKIETIRG